jgi:hypothetical protein
LYSESVIHSIHIQPHDATCRPHLRERFSPFTANLGHMTIETEQAGFRADSKEQVKHTGHSKGFEHEDCCLQLHAGEYETASRSVRQSPDRLKNRPAVDLAR